MYCLLKSIDLVFGTAMWHDEDAGTYQMADTHLSRIHSYTREMEQDMKVLLLFVDASPFKKEVD
jgi:hypothetical protein